MVSMFPELWELIESSIKSIWLSLISNHLNVQTGNSEQMRSFEKPLKWKSIFTSSAEHWAEEQT